jgi:hypothetical protein
LLYLFTGAIVQSLTGRNEMDFTTVNALELQRLRAREEAKKSAIILAKVLSNVEKGVPLDVAYDIVFGAGSYAKLASDIHDVANQS